MSALGYSRRDWLGATIGPRPLRSDCVESRSIASRSSDQDVHDVSEVALLLNRNTATTIARTRGIKAKARGAKFK